MPNIELAENVHSNLKILIFAEGTVLKPKSLLYLYNHNAYLPIGNCVELINGWSKQGAEIVYCTSCKGKKAMAMADILKRFGFAGTKLFYRAKGEKYKDVIEDVKPDILIEDDCRSIGGSWQMCITYVDPELKKSIQSIVVREFKGIDHLPSNCSELRDK